jgi:peptidoglycan biosynthesis protein MviN/MurJ (putative lipid II flippase)
MQKFLKFILNFMYCSTFFGRPHFNHQELNNCSSSLWFYRLSLVVAVLLVVVEPTGRPDHDQQHSNFSYILFRRS